MSERIATREGFGKRIVELGKVNPKIVMVSADLEDATRAELFKNAYPDRFFTVGISEQDMVGMAAGLSLIGFIPFINSFAVFLTNRAYDMLRLDLCYNNCNVKIVCSHGGLTVGEDGASAQCLEDFALMRVLPNMKVVCPADTNEAAQVTSAMAEEKGPIYIRTSRWGLPVLTKPDDKFTIGKAKIMKEGKDVTIVACGVMVSESLSAAQMLEQKGMNAKVINMHTIKPLDEEILIASAKETKAIVTAEEHQINGGLGSAVAETLSRSFPVPIEMVAVKDTFGESGTPEELLKKYHLKDVDIVEAALRAIKRK